MGIFDKNMSMYLLFKLREFRKMGYCGFEGRHYSLFHSIEHDMGQAVNLQILIQALAYKLIAEGKVSHKDIPDSPEIESERRQIFFTAAAELKKFSIKQDTQNQFLNRILTSAKRIKKSRRNKGFNAIRLEDYRQALITFIKNEGAELIEHLGLQETVRDLEDRINGRNAVSDRLVRDILKDEKHTNPIKLTGKRFNHKAEEYYRTELRLQHLAEALESVQSQALVLSNTQQQALQQHLAIKTTLPEWLLQVKQHLISETLNSQEIRQLVGLIIALDCDLTSNDAQALHEESHSHNSNTSNTKTKESSSDQNQDTVNVC
jgi:hypothetical protein